MKSKPPTNSAFDGEGLPLYNMSKPNQILILERVNQNGQRNYMNTISVVSEDLYDIGTAVQK